MDDMNHPSLILRFHPTIGPQMTEVPPKRAAADKWMTVSSKDGHHPRLSIQILAWGGLSSPLRGDTWERTGVRWEGIGA